jgi:GAF domain-containing protein
MTEQLNILLAQPLQAKVDTSTTLQELTKVIGKLLQAHRCCLFLRDPVTRLSQMTHEWVTNPEQTLRRDNSEWTVESPTLEQDDPMFAEALARPEALYINDIRTADPALVNGAFEEQHFGHRALVHAPLYHEGKMYGILEPCVFGESRAWSAAHRAVIERVQTPLAALAAEFVAANCPPDAR